MSMSWLKPGSFLDVLLDAWRHRGTLNDSKKPREALAFLPAALEVQETPPHPLARWLGWSLIALFAIGVLWACFGKVNIVAVAEGKIIPAGKVKTIQPLEKGVVAAIHVKEGQYVEKGDPLVSLDRTLTQAEQQRITHELTTARLALERQQALQARLENNDPDVPVTLPENTPLADRRLQEELLESEWLGYVSRRGSLDSQLATREGQLATNRATIVKLEGTVPLISKRTAALKELLDRNLGSENEYLELEEQRITRTQDLEAARAREGQLQAAVEEIRQQRAALQAETLSKTLEAVSESERRIKSLTEELNKATDLNARQVLYSPVTGQVQQLGIHTIGGVVTEAQPLMVVVPVAERVEVEAFLPNKDIGFVEEGQPAEVKVHTFPFTRYGVIDATVTQVSDDAVADEQKGLIYTMRLQLHRNTINVDGRDVRLIPGMSVTAEVKTGKRRLIEYFLSPLLRYKDESVRER